MKNEKERKQGRITTTRNSYSGYSIEVVRKGKPTQKVAIESVEDVVAFVGEELRLKDREHLYGGERYSRLLGGEYNETSKAVHQ